MYYWYYYWLLTLTGLNFIYLVFVFSFFCSDFIEQFQHADEIKPGFIQRDDSWQLHVSFASLQALFFIMTLLKGNNQQRLCLSYLLLTVHVLHCHLTYQLLLKLHNFLLYLNFNLFSCSPASVHTNWITAFKPDQLRLFTSDVTLEGQRDRPGSFSHLSFFYLRFIFSDLTSSSHSWFISRWVLIT